MGLHDKYGKMRTRKTLSERSMATLAETEEMRFRLTFVKRVPRD
jgi:hypothetical protein